MSLVAIPSRQESVTAARCWGDSSSTSVHTRLMRCSASRWSAGSTNGAGACSTGSGSSGPLSRRSRQPSNCRQPRPRRFWSRQRLTRIRSNHVEHVDWCVAPSSVVQPAAVCPRRKMGPVSPPVLHVAPEVAAVATQVLLGVLDRVGIARLVGIPQVAPVALQLAPVALDLLGVAAQLAPAPAYLALVLADLLPTPPRLLDDVPYLLPLARAPERPD